MTFSDVTTNLGLLLFVVIFAWYTVEICKVNLEVYRHRKLSKLVQIAEDVPVEVPSEVDEYKTEWSNSFDERIKFIKEELAGKRVPGRVGTPALELHPDVHNLPHGEVHTRADLLPVEVAE